MVNVELVRRKLIKLNGYLKELEELKEYTYEDYQNNNLVRRSAERLLQLIVDVAVDINTRVLVDEGEPPPTDYYHSFTDSVKIGLLPRKFAYEIAPSTGERNIIVHEYELIDDWVVYSSIEDAFNMFGEYISHLQEFLKNKK